MDSMKMAFAAVLLLAFAGVGFMFLSGSGTGDASATDGASNMPIDESIPIATGSQAQPSSGQLQVVKVHASSSGYDNPFPTVKAGEAVRLEFSADSSAGCGRQLILDGVGVPVNLVSRGGEVASATFTPPSPGQYRFHCGMNMFRGVLTAQ